jgi:hypothetical protein
MEFTVNEGCSKECLVLLFVREVEAKGQKAQRRVVGVELEKQDTNKTKPTASRSRWSAATAEECLKSARRSRSNSNVAPKEYSFNHHSQESSFNFHHRFWLYVIGCAGLTYLG